MFSLPFLILEIVGDKNATGEGIELIFEHLRSFVNCLHASFSYLPFFEEILSSKFFTIYTK